MSYTPGPWFVGPTPFYLMQGQRADSNSRAVDPITIRSNAHTEEIATVWNCLLPTEANARLIAAAPTMLAALRACVEDMDAARIGGINVPQVCLAMARAAIARADG